MKTIPQQQFWKGGFGKEYLDRNLFTPAQLDKSYRSKFGVTRSQMNKEFLGSLPRNAKILEVGANFGMQLKSLQKMGFTNLYGVELNSMVADFGRKTLRDINLIEGDALNLPFKDGFFDLVFTSGVLIHIAPKDRAKAMREISLWKANFPALYKKEIPSLKLVKQKIYRYKGETNEDVMFLFKKAK